MKIENGKLKNKTRCKDGYSISNFHFSIFNIVPA